MLTEHPRNGHEADPGTTPEFLAVDPTVTVDAAVDATSISQPQPIHQDGKTGTRKENPLGIEAHPVSADIDGVVNGVEIWTYGHRVVLDRDDAFTLLDKIGDALRGRK
ncbi:MAG: hypothetical protein WAW17_10385 [Rhodococcus sp. (in: high G+C Gram-positive bacteria)]|uniref:hypothetical protein n=1 Tax=Rhodococcus sp. TaxID=1831 RepID=UPI003BAF1FDF